MNDSLEELLPRDEDGFFHMALTNGSTVAFAPSLDVEPGEILLVDYEAKTVRAASLETAFQHPGHSVFLMNMSDFESLVEKILSGRIRPKTVQ